MQRVMRATAWLVTGGLVLVSVMMNFRFGQSLGSTPVDGLVYGLASVCADGFKVVLPFAIAQAWQAGRPLAVGVGAALWVAFTGYSMTSSLGHTATNRAEVSGGRGQVIASYQDLRQALETRQRERAGLVVTRPAASIAAEIGGWQLKPAWRASQGCQEATTRELRVWCEALLRLRSEQAVAERAARLDQEIAALIERSAALPAGAQGSADPQVALIRDLTGLDADRVRLALTIMVSLIVELGSGLGVFVLIGPQRSAPPPTDVPAAGVAVAPAVLRLDEPAEMAWRRERLIADPDGTAAELDLYRDYCVWVVRNDRGPALSLCELRAYLSGAQNLVVSRRRGTTYYSGLTLRAGMIPDARALAQTG